MTKDGEVAFWLQPFVVSSHYLPGAVIETQWPTRWSRPKILGVYETLRSFVRLDRQLDDTKVCCWMDGLTYAERGDRGTQLPGCLGRL